MAAVYHMYKLTFQVQFHVYMTAHGITCRNSSMHTVLFTNNVLVISYVHTCTVNLSIYVVCELSNNGQQLLHKYSFWGPHELSLPRAPKMLRPALLSVNFVLWSCGWCRWGDLWVCTPWCHYYSKLCLHVCALSPHPYHFSPSPTHPTLVALTQNWCSPQKLPKDTMAMLSIISYIGISYLVRW